MATVDSTTPKSQLHDTCLIVEWASMLTGDDGAWRLLGHYREKCLHVYGVFGGAIVTLEGTNEDAQTAATHQVGLTDILQNGISLNADGVRQVQENPLFVRPRVAGGDGTTAITVRLVCRP